ncbi:DUF305 domain-containing protein [Limnobacter sp.]|uniref:DUF305 domain-containing protein n=1 Tax=Limnobacter sp. TaxID=2003368 RepID=UPI003513B952
MAPLNPRLWAIPLLCFALGLGLGWGMATFLPQWVKPAEPPPAQPSLDIDLGYAQSMLVHHQQALVMASLILEEVEGSEPSPVQGLAKRIRQAQALEIENIRGWLAGQEEAGLPPDGDLMGWMKRQRDQLNVNETLYLARCEASPLGMAGLVDSASVKKLGRLEIPLPQREQEFLKLMIEHHEGAVQMSTLPARAATTSFIRHMAKHVLQTQSQEILQMRRWLQAAGPGS